jgi:hypothetical protein
MIKKPKVISIVDCFVHDQKVENNLRSCVKLLKDNGHDVLLVSNTKINPEILDHVDYHFYDSRNQLFKNEYPGVIDVDFWTDYQSFVVHNIKSGIQKHGLSVLINLFNSLRLAKELGYTHFQRFETDDIYGTLSLGWINSVPAIVEVNSTKGMFYTNPRNNPPDASFHYFYCEIDYFLESVTTIKSEEDYLKYLMDTQGNNNFKIAEVFLYDHILKMYNEGRIIVRDGETEMKDDFPDTTWNTVTSASNLPEKYKGCLTGIYRVFESGEEKDFFYLYSYNYNNSEITRTVQIKCSDTPDWFVNVSLPSKGAWSYNMIPKTSQKITVYENEQIVFEETISEVKSYIEVRS